MKNRGYAPFYKIPKEETEMTVFYAKPRVLNGTFGHQRVFKVKVGKEDYDSALSEKSPLYRFIVITFARAKKDINIKVMRVGEGKNTRYDAEVI